MMTITKTTTTMTYLAAVGCCLPSLKLSSNNVIELFFLPPTFCWDIKQPSSIGSMLPLHVSYRVFPFNSDGKKQQISALDRHGSLNNQPLKIKIQYYLDITVTLGTIKFDSYMRVLLYRSSVNCYEIDENDSYLEEITIVH